MKTLFMALALSAIAADEFVLLGATEAQLTGLYGTPAKPQTDKDIAPFEKKLVYSVTFNHSTSTAFFIAGKCEGMIVTLPINPELKVSRTEGMVRQILERCGGEWKKGVAGWSRKDGAVATQSPTTGDLTVLSGIAIKARAKFDEAQKQKPIKGL